MAAHNKKSPCRPLPETKGQAAASDESHQLSKNPDTLSAARYALSLPGIQHQASRTPTVSIIRTFEFRYCPSTLLRIVSLSNHLGFGAPS
jgi:hypothetical protein